MTKSRILCCAALVLLTGCLARKSAMTADRSRSAPGVRAAASEVAGLTEGAPDRGGWLLSRAGAANLPAAAKQDRVILIKKGSLTVIVRDAREAEGRLNEILKGYDAYISARQSHAIVPQSKYLGPSEVRSVTLTIKVDAKRFDEFLAQAKQIGSYTSESITTEDVTFAYLDLNARLSNARKVEERLVGYLGDRTKDFKSILEVEKELSRVREQIEQLTTQLRTMENQIAYSTLTLEISVQADYVPPSQRTFWQDVREAFGGSLSAMGATVRMLAIVAVAVLPWLVVILALLYGVYRLISWLAGRKRAKP